MLAYAQENKPLQASQSGKLALAYADSLQQNLINRFLRRLPQQQVPPLPAWNFSQLKICNC